MAINAKNMDKKNMPVFRSEKFRTSFSVERALGIWVDRIGRAVDNSAGAQGMRILGLFGAVAIIKGKGTFITETLGAKKVKAGDIMLLFPDEPHTYFPENAWQTHWIVWGGPEADMLNQSGYLETRYPIVRDRIGVFDQAFDALSPIIDREDLGAVLFRKQILLRLIHDFYTSRNKMQTKKAGPDIQKSVDYIRSHYTMAISIAELAKQIHVSPTHFRRLFKAHTGRNPLRYITSLRISEAKRCLAEGSSIKETAERVGFEDEFYFMRVFKKETGITAGAFISSV